MGGREGASRGHSAARSMQGARRRMPRPGACLPLAPATAGAAAQFPQQASAPQTAGRGRGRSRTCGRRGTTRSNALSPDRGESRWVGRRLWACGSSERQSPPHHAHPARHLLHPSPPALHCPPSTRPRLRFTAHPALEFAAVEAAATAETAPATPEALLAWWPGFKRHLASLCRALDCRWRKVQQQHSAAVGQQLLQLYQQHEAGDASPCPPSCSSSSRQRALWPPSWPTPAWQWLHAGERPSPQCSNYPQHPADQHGAQGGRPGGGAAAGALVRGAGGATGSGTPAACCQPAAAGEPVRLPQAAQLCRPAVQASCAGQVCTLRQTLAGTLGACSHRWPLCPRAAGCAHTARQLRRRAAAPPASAAAHLCASRQQGSQWPGTRAIQVPGQPDLQQRQPGCRAGPPSQPGGRCFPAPQPGCVATARAELRKLEAPCLLLAAADNAGWNAHFSASSCMHHALSPSGSIQVLFFDGKY